MASQGFISATWCFGWSSAFVIIPTTDPFFFDKRGALNDLQFTGDDFFIDKDVCSIVLENSQLCAWTQTSWPMGAHAGRRQRGLGPGGPGRVTGASGLSRRRGARRLPRRRAGERCPFRRLRACAGAHRWLCTGGSKEGRENTAARHAVLRPYASCIFSEQRPYANRRCRRRLPGSPHKREGERGQGRASICLPSSPIWGRRTTSAPSHATSPIASERGAPARHAP
jgi:hypothetical protein